MRLAELSIVGGVGQLGLDRYFTLYDLGHGPRRRRHQLHQAACPDRALGPGIELALLTGQRMHERWIDAVGEQALVVGQDADRQRIVADREVAVEGDLGSPQARFAGRR